MICGISDAAPFARLPWYRPFRTEWIDGIRVVVCNVAYGNVQRVPRRLCAFFAFVVLTIAADQHPHAGGFLRAIEKPGLRDHIINVGPLPQSDLAAHYHNCQALFLPTLLESFSSTYLEAMHFGLPILTCDLDFAHAVCGEAGSYFDPWDTRSMKNAILRLKANPDLGKEMVSRGKARLRMAFKSWDENAVRVAAALEELVSQHGDHG